MSNVMQFNGGAKITPREREDFARWLAANPKLQGEAVETDDGRDVLTVWRGNEEASYSIARFGSELVVLGPDGGLVIKVRALDVALDAVARAL